LVEVSFESSLKGMAILLFRFDTPQKVKWEWKCNSDCHISRTRR